MRFTLVDFCKICGILFLIVFSWYFVFTVFKTNKNFLKALSSTKKNVLGNLFGNNTVEGFEGKGLTRLENVSKSLNDHILSMRKVLQLDEDGKEEQRKLITNILEKYEKAIKLFFIFDMLHNTGKEWVPNPALIVARNEVEKMNVLWKEELQEAEDNGY